MLPPDRTIQVTIKIVGYVDDTNNRTNAFLTYPQPPLPTLIQAGKQDFQIWHDLLHSASQKLELPKCSFHLLHHHRLPSGESYFAPGPPPIPLQLHDSNNNLFNITGLSTYTAHKTLGFHKSPGGQNKQLDALRHNAQGFAKALLNSFLNRRESR